MSQGEGERYRVIGLLGRGGSGDVERVLDRRLRRALARKRLRVGASEMPLQTRRFAEEARLQARLSHPGVPPVHDLMRDEEDRAAFTLPEVRGRTLAEAIGAVFAASTAESWGVAPDGTSLHRLVGALARVADTLAHAHARGVVHRDLKPVNLMLGEHGAVYVMDWGIAVAVGAVADAPQADASPEETLGVWGTPAYMAPEVARGKRALLGPAIDVFGLGATLYEILSGRPPYADATLMRTLWLAAHAEFPPPGREGGPPPPPELVAICRSSMAADPADRPADAATFARILRDWLDGVTRREAALARVEQARLRLADRDRLLAEAGTLRAEAARALQGVRPWEPEARKRDGWALEEQAAAAFAAASGAREEAEVLLESALGLDSGCGTARQLLCVLRRADVVAADLTRDAAATALAEARLHDAAIALPRTDPERAALLDWIGGAGWVSLETEPSGARLSLERFELRGRRLEAVPCQDLGVSPVRDLPIGRGSYRLRIRHPGCEEVLLPVVVGRGERWALTPPGATEPPPLRLPLAGLFAPDDVYVPPGWCLLGGAPDDGGGVLRRCWLDGFVIKRDPLTVGQLARAVERMRSQGRDDLVELLGGAGQPSADGGDRAFDLPVTGLDYAGVTAFAAWKAEVDGLPWRLPTEDEWEKAARGVDGRRFPMGDVLLPVWTWCHESAPQVTGPAPVTTLHRDVGPYGMRGATGNVMCWCLAEPEALIVPIRGGDWSRKASGLNLARRHDDLRVARHSSVGLRLARPL